MKLTNKHQAPIGLPAHMKLEANGHHTQVHAAVEIEPGKSIDLDAAHYAAIKDSPGMQGLLRSGLLDDGADHSHMSDDDKSRRDASAVVKDGPAPNDGPSPEPLPVPHVSHEGKRK